MLRFPLGFTPPRRIGVRPRALWLPFSLLAFFPAHADSVPVPDARTPSPDFVTTVPEALPEPIRITPAAPVLPAGTATDAVLPAERGDEAAFVRRLQSDTAFAERLIQASLTQRRWDWLAFLLPVYRAIPQHDAVLADFAEGMMWREQGKIKPAIALYRGILARRPDLLYVRLNLAAMLYQDRQFEAAADQFRKIAADDALDTPARSAVNQYLAVIQKQQKWRYGVGLNYEHTDNVNNASSDRFIWVNGKCFGIAPGLCLTKDEASLPRPANGIRYNADVARDFNIGGNHYLTVGAGVDGVNYWDARDFNEFNWKLETGYAYRDVKRQLSLKPYWSQMRLGREQYSRSTGVAAEFGYWLSPQWQLMLTGDATRIEYPQHRHFDGKRINLSATMVFMPRAGTLLFAGTDGTRSGARIKSQVYYAYGARFGVVQEWPWGISTRLQWRYGRKNHLADKSFYGYRRHDKEYLGMLTVWHRAMSVWGVTPKLNLQHSKIDSNQASFYSRQANRVFVSLEKTF